MDPYQIRSFHAPGAHCRNIADINVSFQKRLGFSMKFIKYALYAPWRHARRQGA